MLSQAHPLKALVVALALASPLVALSQQAAPVPQAEPDAAAELLKSLPSDIARSLNKEQIKEAQSLGAEAVRNILDAYNQRDTSLDTMANQTRRRVDTIADETMQAERDSVLRFLGIEPDSESALFTFVSWSMPLDMLRSYAIESMWSGSTLVFKGVPPGKELGDFIMKDLQQLVYGKGAAANISIDPRLYDAYAVNTVPTIVFTRVRNDIQCQGVEPVVVPLDKDRSTEYQACPPLDPSSFWKLSGAVTTSYALQAFIDDGAVDAKPNLDALARGWGGQAPSKEQKPFTGKWEDAISPSELKAAQDAARAVLPGTPAPGP